MYSVLLALLINSAAASVLLFCIWLVKKVFRLKLSAGMHYLIWGVVILKLVLPVQIPAAFSPWNLIPQMKAVSAHLETPFAAPETPKEITAAGEMQPVVQVGTAAASGQKAAGVPAESEAVNALTEEAEQEPFTVNWENVFPAVWAAGMAATGLWLALGILRLSRSARGAKPAPYWAALVFEECKGELNIKRGIRLSVENISVPAVRGLFRPVVMLPASLAEKKDEEGMRLILLHELEHIKRADIAAAYLINIINVIYWFNPAVWLMARLISADMETACDASVLRVLGEESRQPYIEILVRCAGDRADALMRPSLCLSDSGVNMKRRIEGMFLNKKTKRPVKAAVTVIVLMLAAVCFTSACAPAGLRHISNAAPVHTDSAESGASASTSLEHSVNGEISAMFSTEDGKNYYVITDYPGTDDETVFLTYDYSSQAHDVVEKYETDYVVPISLTDREKMFAGVFANPGDFLAFNYKTSKAGAYVWLEEYNYGVRSQNGPAFDSFLKGQKGSIIFSKIVDDPPKFYLVVQGASDRMGYAGSLENVNDVSGYIKGINKETSVSGDVLLGCFVYKDGNLSDAFFSDNNSHLDELKAIPKAFLIKCRFLSSEEIDSMTGPA